MTHHTTSPSNGRGKPAFMPTADALPDIGELTRTEARMVRELAESMGAARTTAGLCLARTRHLLEGTVAPGVALPHVQACGLLSARLITVYERCLRTYGHHRREMAALAARHGAAGATDI